MKEAIPPRVVIGIGELLWDLLPGGRQLGGAPANFAYHVHAQGECAMIASAVGDDRDGEAIRAALAGQGLDLSLLQTDPVHPTGTVTIDLDEKGKPQYTIHEEVAWDFIAGGAELTGVARWADAVCFGTLAQRAPVSRATIQGIVESTRPQCLRVFDINLRQRYFTPEIIQGSLELAHVLKLNDEELPLLASQFRLGEGSAKAQLEALTERFDLETVALTRGSAGSLLLRRGEASEHPGHPVGQVVDTVGAGDSFTAALVVGLLRGDPLEQINHRANRLASYVCSRHGAMPPLPERFHSTSHS